MTTITKYEHACLIIDKAGSKLVVDPGCFTKLPADLSNIVCVIVTEEHVDHLDIDNLKSILAQSPNAKIFTTKVASSNLAEAKITSTAIAGNQTIKEAGYTLQFYETDHAPTYKNSPCRSLSVKVDDYLYYPGDSYNTTQDEVKILALPTSGPWHKIEEAIDFANSMKSQYILATHNGLYNADGNGVANHFITMNLKDASREFIYLDVGQSKTI